ncbi:hypothetical protein VPH35_125443 [Triticum aestivum]|nr:uncharacterized protein LOC123154429 [Triticum aestivum]
MDYQSNTLSNFSREERSSITKSRSSDLPEEALMAEILGSAVASESVSRIFSILSGNSREDGGAEDNAERLEFAVLKIHSVVAVAEDWRILHQPLLDWKARLKRVAEEGDGILRAHRRRSAERERDEGVARKAVPVHKRVTRAAARFLPFRRGKDDDGDPGEATVRRFERLAHVADEFFRYVQLGGRPKSLTVSMEVPAEPLLAGKTLEFSLRNGSRDALLLLHPCDGNGEVVLFLSCDDSAAWEKNVKLCVVFQLLERTDILDIVMSSLQLLPPQFGAACATAREFVREARAQETSYAGASSMSMRCVSSAWRCHRNSTDGGCAATDGMPRLPWPIVRVDAVYFAMPQNYSPDAPADQNKLLKLACHITPHLVPETYSRHYRQIGTETLQELSPEVADEGASACGREAAWWCPRSSTFLSVEPEFSVPPPTLQQLFLVQSLKGAM